MAAFGLAEYLIGDFSHAFDLPPVVHLAAHPGLVATGVAETVFRIDFGERRIQGRRVAAMAVDEEKAVEPVQRQGFDHVAHDRD